MLCRLDGPVVDDWPAEVPDAFIHAGFASIPSFRDPVSAALAD
jgi:hypothetical protein